MYVFVTLFSSGSKLFRFQFAYPFGNSAGGVFWTEGKFVFWVCSVCFPLKPSVWLQKYGGVLSTSRDLDTPATSVSFSPLGFSSSKSNLFTKSIVLQSFFHLKQRNS